MRVNRPQITVVLAMTADGKISDYQRSPARFGSAADKAHLEWQISQADAVLFGAGTLRAYGTTLRVSNPEYLQERERLSKPLQPVQIVCSNSGNFGLDLPFFSQPVPRWLLTSNANLKVWEQDFPDAFEKILVHSSLVKSEKDNLSSIGVDWQLALTELWQLGIHKLVVLGGGDLIASLLIEDVIDELWLTICPYLVGGEKAPTAIAGSGLLLQEIKTLQLKEVKTIGDELFLHYRCR